MTQRAGLETDSPQSTASLNFHLHKITYQPVIAFFKIESYDSSDPEKPLDVVDISQSKPGRRCKKSYKY